MIYCIDVDYRPDAVVTAAVGFERWSDSRSTVELVIQSKQSPEPYEPGQFYRRELPFLVAMAKQLPEMAEVIIVDGFVWLGDRAPGLGAHLFEALHRSVVIVGVAKRSYRGAVAVPVFRGASRRPVLVSSAGIEPVVAAEHVAGMHGEHRIPTLIRRADTLSRTL